MAWHGLASGSKFRKDGACGIDKSGLLLKTHLNLSHEGNIRKQTYMVTRLAPAKTSEIARLASDACGWLGSHKPNLGIIVKYRQHAIAREDSQVKALGQRKQNSPHSASAQKKTLHLLDKAIYSYMTLGLRHYKASRDVCVHERDLIPNTAS